MDTPPLRQAIGILLIPSLLLVALASGCPLTSGDLTVANQKKVKAANCKDAGVASFAVLSYSDEEAFFSKAESQIPAPLQADDLCSNPTQIQNTLDKLKNLHLTISMALYSESPETLLPQGIHVLLVKDSPGSEAYSKGPSTLQTVLNSTPLPSGGGSTLPNSLKINLPGSDLEDFDESIYLHEWTHALIESSDFVKQKIPLLALLNEQSHFAEFYADLSAYLVKGKSFSSQRWAAANSIRDLSPSPYTYDSAHRDQMLQSTLAKVILTLEKTIHLDASTISALEKAANANASREDPHLTGVSFGRILSKLDRKALLGALRSSLQTGNRATDWVNNLEAALPSLESASLTHELGVYKATNWIRFLETDDLQDLYR